MCDEKRERDERRRAGDEADLHRGAAADLAVEAAASGGLSAVAHAVTAVGRAVAHGARAAVEALT
ncbi:hypothetical protein [Streptomyces caatingaensis]|uniref:Uncharacterized protein n=1 Tax=Streptomyces caatingaensis TaxID=1678637 RepID=A0A0K9XEL7_9ACTN|nr:hypothetical protein [Streptomyces caatingaensis]KNB51107.1 hypothetical protein AC230_18360 [Streptomyces caatingaensis]